MQKFQVQVDQENLQKYGILHFWPEGKSRMRVLFFSRGDRIGPVVLECLERVHANGK